MAATTANVAWPIQANSPSIPSFRKSLVPKNDFNVYKSLITQDKGSYINRMFDSTLITFDLESNNAKFQLNPIKNG